MRRMRWSESGRRRGRHPAGRTAGQKPGRPQKPRDWRLRSSPSLEAEGIGMNCFKSKLGTLALGLALAAALSTVSLAAPKKDFKVAWSIYVGWMPWGYAADNGIVKKWADKYGIKIERDAVQRLRGVDQPVHGRRLRRPDRHQHGCAVGSVRRAASTPRPSIVGDFSNGNDAVILKDKTGSGRYQGPEGQSRRSSRCRIICSLARSTASSMSEKDSPKSTRPTPTWWRPTRHPTSPPW